MGAMVDSFWLAWSDSHAGFYGATTLPPPQLISRGALVAYESATLRVRQPELWLEPLGDIFEVQRERFVAQWCLRVAGLE